MTPVASAALRGKAAVAGVGESDIGKVPGTSGLGLNAQACKRAAQASSCFGG